MALPHLVEFGLELDLAFCGDLRELISTANQNTRWSEAVRVLTLPPQISNRAIMGRIWRGQGQASINKRAAKGGLGREVAKMLKEDPEGLPIRNRRVSPLPVGQLQSRLTDDPVPANPLDLARRWPSQLLLPSAPPARPRQDRGPLLQILVRT
jgi:hypothetical protein